MSGRKMDRLRVLIVDDNHHMINIVKTILRGFGIKEFFEARDPVDAFDRLRATHIDMVITDFAMDPIDGCEFVRLIRTADDSPNRYIPIIMLTAYSERPRVEAARDAGINEFCAKPVTAMELYRKVVSLVNAPRPYVRTSGFFGPDRRRHPDDDFEGDNRREGPFESEDDASDDQKEAAPEAKEAEETPQAAEA